MTLQKTLEKKSVKQPETAQAEAPPAGPSPLLEQAQGWAAVAREAHANCQKGAEAEQVYERRRNRSGQ
jgi:hypothetical protein